MRKLTRSMVQFQYTGWIYYIAVNLITYCGGNSLKLLHKTQQHLDEIKHIKHTLSSTRQPKQTGNPPGRFRCEETVVLVLAYF